MTLEGCQAIRTTTASTRIPRAFTCSLVPQAEHGFPSPSLVKTFSQPLSPVDATSFMYFMYFKCISNLFHFSLSTVLVLHPYNFSPGTGLQLPAVLPSPMAGRVFYLILHLLLSTTVLKSKVLVPQVNLFMIWPQPASLAPFLFLSLSPFLIRTTCRGTSLVVQWLRFCVHCRGAWVRSLLRELRSLSHTVWSKRKKRTTCRSEFTKNPCL